MFTSQSRSRWKTKLLVRNREQWSRGLRRTKVEYYYTSFRWFSYRRVYLQLGDEVLISGTAVSGDVSVCEFENAYFFKQNFHAKHNWLHRVVYGRNTTRIHYCAYTNLRVLHILVRSFVLNTFYFVTYDIIQHFNVLCTVAIRRRRRIIVVERY